MPEPTPPAKPFSLCIGARDWEHPAWDRDYYPEDLPAEWRLAYYANELRQVLVPQSRWETAGEACWAGWREDVGLEFRFFLELDSGPLPGELAACAAALGTHCGGVLAASPEQLAGLGDVPGYLGRSLAGPEPPIPGPLPVALVLAELGDLRAQRRLFEALAAGFVGQGDLPLFLGGEAPSVPILLAANQLAELLGLA